MVPPASASGFLAKSSLTSASQVVALVEATSRAALIDAGIVATTATHGANAPVEKTD